MTKEQYFEMCQELGSEPIEEEIPVELGDFPLECIEAYELYTIIPDMWDTFSGRYLGKEISSIPAIMEILEIPSSEKKLQLRLVLIFDRVRKQYLSQVAAQNAARK